MTTYVYDLPDWPNFRWDPTVLASKLAKVRYKQGELTGRMKCLGFGLRDEAVLQTLTLDVAKSSEIEGVNLDVEQVRSSVARHLGMDRGGLPRPSRAVEGVVEMVLDATQNYAQPLTKERLFAWHASLFPTGESDMHTIRTGAWRDDRSGPMQVVSGRIGRERVHFQAPAAARIEPEMKAFLEWFNHDDGNDLVLRSCVAHLWFVTIHPFEDGNGRIARALMDMFLARSEKSTRRFYSMSAQIRDERPEYYAGIEAAQKGTLDITARLDWFLDTLNAALDNAGNTLSRVLRKAGFWERYAQEQFNPRQQMVLNRLLDHFEGKLTATKWARLTKRSPDTALRDITDLVERGILVKEPGGGRSTSYSLNFQDQSESQGEDRGLGAGEDADGNFFGSPGH
ncbi:MAG: Fic/DOC family protein [Syntrophorhabdus sp. PtaB.Bin047]|nr:MAG: Fic/DOC family protein [Syntrophorhabdus sp. PtaB.Bin047]